MITKDNFKELLLSIGFEETEEDIYEKKFEDIGAFLKADFNKKELIYPENNGGVTINSRDTCNFSSNENFVVFECVNRLFEKGYKPEHIVLEPRWQVGHGASGGRADILIKDNDKKSLLIIECKTAGREFVNAWKQTLNRPTQLFSYAQQARSSDFITLYTSDFIDGRVVEDYYLITLKDNETLLEELKDKEPVSYKDANSVEEIWHAWEDTYEQDYATHGLFEEDIQPYKIGKEKFSANDLKKVNYKDIQGKYHQFATILRQHNVSGRENAFDKLVNLFLCKIVDESQNPDDLKFYWKGIAYDSYFDLQDRLQKLYQIGMKELLGEDVTYIDNQAIDDAFRFFENDPDATRDTIKQYFRDLKFFTNNDFAFIDVHNEKLFRKNSAVLLKIVHMLQDIQLKTDEQNQFLGDMFEGFLDQGVKQSEGQFFTPMPIVKFILKSLPLEEIIKNEEEIPHVIDYACGAGHFLNEYAKQLEPLVEKHTEKDINEYYPQVVGIEKEYRLSKVAKVSSFMYGQDDVKIIYADALGELEEVKDGTFSILVANPPYSVKGYLETLEEHERDRYSLIEAVNNKTYPTNNSIETFFIERAKQLLKPGGIAGIIVPASVLTKGSSKSTTDTINIYVAARELLLKYFDIISITELSSTTFGKTGTKTVVLFLRRKKDDPAPAVHYKNRIEDWFKGKTDKDGIFEDADFIKKYCQQVDYDVEDYYSLLKGTITDKLQATDTFTEYKTDFDGWTEIKNRKKQSSFKSLSEEEQSAELEAKYLQYIREIEKDKLYYFVMASLNEQEVVIVRSPSSTNKSKKFLGYEWSSAKGNEGIKYRGSATVPDMDEDGDEEELDKEDERVLENIIKLDNIQTPLYDPQNLHNPDKINHYIASNFIDTSIEVPENLQEYVKTARLVDMLDFSRRDFNKAIDLSPSRKVVIETKWDLIRLGKVIDVLIGGTPSRSNSNYFTGNNLWVSISEMNGQKILDTDEKITKKAVEDSNVKLIPKGTTLLSFKLSIGKTAIAGKNLYTNEAIAGLVPKSNADILNEYIFQLFNAKQIDLESVGLNSFGKSLNSKYLKNEVLIPLPPKKVQKNIVNACEEIDKKVEQAKEKIAQSKKEIEDKVSAIYGNGYDKEKVRDLFEINTRAC